MAKTSQFASEQSEEHIGAEGSAWVIGVPSSAKIPTFNLFLSRTRDERDGPMDMPRTDDQPESISFCFDPASVSSRALP